MLLDLVDVGHGDPRQIRAPQAGNRIQHKLGIARLALLGVRQGLAVPQLPPLEMVLLNQRCDQGHLQYRGPVNNSA